MLYQPTPTPSEIINLLTPIKCLTTKEVRCYVLRPSGLVTSLFSPDYRTELNNLCVQAGWELTFEDNFSGPQHNGTWTSTASSAVYP